MPAGIDRRSAAPMYDQLRRLIIDGIERDGLQPGDPLPGEHRLCEQYGISRTVVRQALAHLEHEGLVERVKGKGTFVAHHAPANRWYTPWSACTTTWSAAADTCTAMCCGMCANRPPPKSPRRWRFLRDLPS